MFRKMMTALALVALLMVAACNSVTGPAAGSSQPPTGGNRGPAGDRRGSEIGKGVEVVPELPGGGGPGPREPIHVAPGARGPRTPGEISPPSDDPNAGSGSGDVQPIGDPMSRRSQLRDRPAQRGEHGN